MKHRVLNLAAGVSLLLAVTIVVLWVRSYTRQESIHLFWHTSTEARSFTIGTHYSWLDFKVGRDPYTGPPIAATYRYDDFDLLASQRPRPQFWFPFPPVRPYHFFPPSNPYDIATVAVAYWLLLLPTLPLPLIAFARHRRRRQRETNNLCPTCGYDLRATPEKSGPLFDRCPECGTVPATSIVPEHSA